MWTIVQVVRNVVLCVFVCAFCKIFQFQSPGSFWPYWRKFDASCCMWNELKQMNADLQPLPIVTTEQIHKTTSLSSLLLSVALAPALAPSLAHSSHCFHVQCIVRFLKSEKKNETKERTTRQEMQWKEEKKTPRTARHSFNVPSDNFSFSFYIFLSLSLSMCVFRFPSCCCCCCCCLCHCSHVVFLRPLRAERRCFVAVDVALVLLFFCLRL